MASTDATMATADGIPTGEELQRHARWIARLSGALLRDPAAAEDLAQDARLAALDRLPAGARLRPWLRKVLHNFARQHHRGSARRAERELVARPPAAPEAPDAFAMRLEAEQRLTSELAALGEPLRTVLMLRYYEDLEPAEIAARLGLPGGTVRWRLMRGLELLRDRLDRAHGGDRSAWSLAFLPLTRAPVSPAVSPAGAPAVAPAAPVAPGVAAATTTSVVLPGVVLMNVFKLSAAAVAVLALAFGLSMSGLLPDSLSLAHRERPLAVEFRPLELEPVDVPPALAAVADEPAAERERVAVAVERAADTPPTAAAPATATIDARLFGRGRALTDARLVVVHDGARHEALSTGPDGLATCTFPLAQPSNMVRVELRAFGFASEERSAVCEQGGTTHLGRIDLAPGGAVSGRVVDERGVGLAGCRVSLGALDVPYVRLEAARLQPAGEAIPSATTDDAGRFRLLGVAAGMTRLWARASQRKGAYTPPLEVRAGQESTGVELVLEPLAPENVLRGIVLDPAGEPVPRAKIAYRHELDGGSSVTSGERSADRDGRFEFLLPEDARSTLRASDPDGRWSPASLADVANGARELVLQLRQPREVELVVRGRGREPVETFAVELLGVIDSDGLAELVADVGPERADEVLAEFAPRIGGVARGEHAGGRVRIALPEQPFLVRVLAPAHRALRLGPLDPGRVPETLECTLEPAPGLAGIVLRAGEPVSGVRVELRAEVEADMEVVVNGFHQRLHPDARDQAHTDAEGRFLLTPRSPGRYVVRAVPVAGAPAELGPIELDSALMGPPLELHLGRGGAIEGRVELAGGADPEGAIVGVTRGDGAERTLRVARDGRFRFEDLIPGPWRVELRGEEVFGPMRSGSTTRGTGVRPFELAANCVVHEGETTFVDVSDAPEGSVLLAGRLTVDERPAVGWSARLGPPDRLELEDDGWVPLDADGRFELRAREPGDYRLALRQQGREHVEQYLFDDVTLTGVDAPWERELHTGTLRLTGIDTWDGEGMPRVVHHWKGTGALFGLAVPVGAQLEPAISVPAGPAELRAPSESQDPDSWRLLRTIDVPRGAELRVELRASELDG